ncbi:hypothetical protein KUF57_12640 [Mycolicibacterium sp. PAM1]|uniref:hypothetical protein n=1 Tax=Mycolicibacterium sp. PAM1 TaxID=2853535 RepID=UPI001C3CFDB0|nr:hypothetical protein [Mycolicibacterium sp. PAM1]MBV5244382.1 hypothetical protein [Mycolicibacterium sp. PAM1]
MPDKYGYHLIAELPADGSREKEVFARFGLALYTAQVFDHALVNLLTVTRSIEGIYSLDEIDRSFENLFKKTTGGLVTDIGSESLLQETDLEICRRAVAERNRLAHRFFRDNAEDFISSKGQQLMIDDLGEVVVLIQAADAACHRVMMRIGARFGMTEGAVERQMELIVDKIKTSGVS